MAKQSALKVPTGLSPEKQAKVDAILKKYEEQNRQIEREHAKEMAKLYGGAALQIGSAFIPGTLGLKLAGGAIKGLAPIVGRKIAQNVATGVTSGLASGAVEGLGRGLMENQNPLKTMATDSLAGGLLGGLGGYGLGKVAQKLNTQTAWHGSPYKFDKFSNEAIGTGEGAQAHGYGHYAAKNKDVADRYRRELSDDIDTFDDIGTRIKVGDRAYNKVATNTFRGEPQDVTSVFFDEGIDDSLNKAINYYNNFKGDKNKALSFVQNKIDNAIENRDYSTGADFVRIKEALQGNDFELLYKAQPNQGQLYKLSIPKDDLMLREDLPFSEQPLKVQEGLKAISDKYLPKYFFNNMQDQIDYNKSGKSIYNAILGDINSLNPDVINHNNRGQFAGKLLDDYGIKGISYNGGIDGEANVIFNPDDIDIIPYYDNPTSFKEKFINLLNR